MTCGYCGRPALAFEDLQGGHRVTIYECPGCRRERIPRHDPDPGEVREWLWMPMGGYCPSCKTPSWRLVQHPKTARLVLLWPIPTSVTAQHWTPTGSAVHGTFCGTCCPEIGDPACRHVLAADGGAGGVIGYERAPARYGYWYTEDYGRWLRAWLHDELGLEEAEYTRVVAQWEEDRAACV